MGWASYAKAGTSLLSGALSAYNSYSSGKNQAKVASTNASANAASLKAQGAKMAIDSKINAINYDADADYYLRAAKNFQLAGTEERARRGLLLGQDKGDIMAQAAGSGIEASSKIVGKAVKDTARSAYNDMLTSIFNEYQSTYGAMKNRAVAMTNAQNQRNISNWAQEAYNSLASCASAAGALEASAYEAAGKSGMWNGILSGAAGAFGNLRIGGGGTETTYTQGDGIPNYAGSGVKTTPSMSVMGHRDEYTNWA